MPFGLTNAPAVFQHLMQQALTGLNPKEGPVYIDDILVFSRNLEEHESFTESDPTLDGTRPKAEAN